MKATTWVALLRGINVGRNKRLAMADLRALLGSLGFHNVRTHLQSGNALFTSELARAAGQLERGIALGIQTELGMDVKVLVRSSGELAAVVAANPFSAKGDPKQLQATFLSAAPLAKRVGGLDRHEFAPDEFAIGDRVIYARVPNGFMASRLPDWERLLGLSATTRTWNTVTRLCDLAGDLADLDAD